MPESTIPLGLEPERHTVGTTRLANDTSCEPWVTDVSRELAVISECMSGTSRCALVWRIVGETIASLRKSGT